MPDYNKPIDIVLSRLDRPKPSGPGRWQACCPAHDDRHPSLSISEAEGMPGTDDGTVGLKCHAGCDTEAVLRAIGLKYRDLFPQQSSPSQQRKSREDEDDGTFEAIPHVGSEKVEPGVYRAQYVEHWPRARVWMPPTGRHNGRHESKVNFVFRLEDGRDVMAFWNVDEVKSEQRNGGIRAREGRYVMRFLEQARELGDPRPRSPKPLRGHWFRVRVIDWGDKSRIAGVPELLGPGEALDYGATTGSQGHSSGSSWGSSSSSSSSHGHGHGHGQHRPAQPIAAQGPQREECQTLGSGADAGGVATSREGLVVRDTGNYGGDDEDDQPGIVGTDSGKGPASRRDTACESHQDDPRDPGRDGTGRDGPGETGPARRVPPKGASARAGKGSSASPAPDGRLKPTSPANGTGNSRPPLQSNAPTADDYRKAKQGE